MLSLLELIKIQIVADYDEMEAPQRCTIIYPQFILLFNFYG